MKKTHTKKLAVILLLSASLCLSACGEKEDGGLSKVPAADIGQPSAKDAGGGASTAQYSIDRMDNSGKNANGEVLILSYYDLVSFDSSQPFADKMNAETQADYENFRNTDEDWGDIMDTPGLSPEYPFQYTHDGRVTYNEKGFFSAAYSTLWYMGGVANSDNYGINFDLSTGELLTLYNIFPVDRSVMDCCVRDRAKLYLEENGYRALFPGSFTGLDEMSLDKAEGGSYYSFGFYIENGELILCIPTYAIGPGAAGSFLIPSGLYAGDISSPDEDLFPVLTGADPNYCWRHYSAESEDGIYYYEYVDELSLNSDGTFNASSCFLEGDMGPESSGHFSLDGNRLTLEVEISNGTPSSASCEYEVIRMGDNIVLRQLSDASAFYKEKGALLGWSLCSRTPAW